MSNLINLQRLRKILPLINRRLVSSSSKNNSETATTSTTTTTSPLTTTHPFAAKAKDDRNWIYYGFDITNKDNDRRAMHQIMFVTITLCIVGGAYFFAYVPDANMKDWTIREAFLELRRREAKGLPLVDPNLVDPSKFNLPSDEELGDTEIII